MNEILSNVGTDALLVICRYVGNADQEPNPMRRIRNLIHLSRVSRIWYECVCLHSDLYFWKPLCHQFLHVNQSHIHSLLHERFHCDSTSVKLLTQSDSNSIYYGLFSVRMSIRMKMKSILARISARQSIQSFVHHSIPQNTLSNAESLLNLRIPTELFDTFRFLGNTELLNINGIQMLSLNDIIHQTQSIFNQDPHHNSTLIEGLPSAQNVKWLAITDSLLMSRYFVATTELSFDTDSTASYFDEEVHPGAVYFQTGWNAYKKATDFGSFLNSLIW